MLRRLPLTLLVVSACGGAPPLLEPPAPRARPSSPAAPSAVGPAVAAPTTSTTASAAAEAVPPPSAEPAPAEVPKPAALVQQEPPYSALGHPRLATEMQTLGRDEELFQWALGGSVDPAHPANRPGYHPATRVVVDVQLLSRAPKGSTARLQRVARSNGYWPLRSCFENAQRVAQKSERSARVRLTLGATGKVLGARSMGPTPEPDYARCVLARVRALDFTPGFTRKLDVEVSLKQWPGHAPVPPRAPDGSPTPHLSSDALSALAGLTPALTTCYEQGLATDAKLWGRIAFKLELGSDGVKQATPIETHFPNAEVTECARQTVLGARFSSPGLAELSWAVRLGQPPAPPADEPSPPLGAPLMPGSGSLPTPPAPPAPQ